eukprot:1760041-Karenia_brevis.AAC.1
MSVNVVERLLIRLLPAAGLAHHDSFIDRWAMGLGFSKLASSKGKGFCRGSPSEPAANLMDVCCSLHRSQQKLPSILCLDDLVPPSEDRSCGCADGPAYVRGVGPGS